VVALVRDNLLDHGDLIVGHGRHGLKLLRGFRRRLLHRARIAIVGILHRDADDRTGLKVDSVLGLVSQMGSAILHLRDLRIGIMRMRPVVVRRFLLPFPI
jgi:hypothetical protein